MTAGARQSASPPSSTSISREGAIPVMTTVQHPTPFAPPRARSLPRWLMTLLGRPSAEPGVVVAAGPCSVTELEKLLRVAEALRAGGAAFLRGGAYKPRSAPHLFQGLGLDGLKMLAEARLRTGLAVVTEVVDVRHLELVLGYADIVQIGARNMQNYPLLTEVGRAGCVVMLKRHFSATIAEVVGALDYIRVEGNERVLLCERGIRTFERDAYRFTLDVSAVPVLQELTGQPVFVDPSHAAGRRALVPALSRAAIAAGADGLLVEVDEDPDRAPSDAPQQLRIEDFAGYTDSVRRIAFADGRPVLAPG